MVSATVRLWGLTSNPYDAQPTGTARVINSNRFGATSALFWVTPVTLPPGRLKLATRPSSTGSAPVQRRSESSRSPPLPPAPLGVVVAAITVTWRCTDQPPVPAVGHFGPPPSGTRS